jgi:MoaA/NifB/PqqE/SkfB family radical SAM enzyme
MNFAFDYLSTFGKFLFSKNLVHVVLHVTNHCNYRCQHCFIDFSPKKDLKLHDYQKLGKQIGKFFWLDIGGGEPFLRKDLAEIIASFNSRFVGIPTNGSLTDQIIDETKRIKALGNRDIILSLSVDGLEDTHDKIRGQDGSWKSVWETFEQLRKIDGVYVKILTVVHDGNAKEIIPLMKEVKKKGPDNHSVILVRGETIDDNIHLPPVSELRELGREIFAIQESYDHGNNPLVAHLLKNYHRYVWNISLKTIEEERQIVPCLAGQAHMVVYGDGRVSSCEMLDTVGNVQSQGWDEIINSQVFKKQVEDIVAGKCHCTYNCALMDSVFFNPKSIPHFISEKVD